MDDNVIPMPKPPASPGAGPVVLPVTEIFHDMADTCRTLHFMGVATAPPGCGKTTAWKMLAAQDPDNVRLITCHRGLTSGEKKRGRLGPFLNLVLEALGLEIERNYFVPLDDRMQRIVDWLRCRQPNERKAHGPLLIFDEAQYLNADMYNTARWVWDRRLGRRENSCGMIFAGNPTVTRDLLGGTERPGFAEFTSRIAIRRALKGTERADVLALCAHFGIGDAGCRDYLCGVAEKPGALRLVANVVKVARIEGGGGRLTVAQLRDAAESIGI